MRVSQDFYYPDVFVTCADFDPKALFQSTPILIIEVLSDSTARIDRQEKRLAYQRLASLKEYVLVAQDRQQIELYRHSEGGWALQRFDTDDALHLESVNLRVLLTEIYRDIPSVTDATVWNAVRAERGLTVDSMGIR